MTQWNCVNKLDTENELVTLSRGIWLTVKVKGHDASAHVRRCHRGAAASVIGATACAGTWASRV